MRLLLLAAFVTTLPSQALAWQTSGDHTVSRVFEPSPRPEATVPTATSKRAGDTASAMMTPATISLYASPDPASVPAGIPPGRTLFAVRNVPPGHTPTLVPDDGRFQIRGSGADTVVQTGSLALEPGKVDVTISAQGRASTTIPVEIVASPSSLIAKASALYSLFKMNATYSGPAARVSAVDRSGALIGKPFDVVFSSSKIGSHIDYVAMYANARAVSGALADRVRVVQIYDQSGHSRNLTTPDNSRQTGPWMMERYQRDGMQPITFAGNRNWARANTVDGPDNFLIIPKTLAPNRNDFSVFMACEPHSSRNLQNYIVFGQAAASWQMRQYPAAFGGLAIGVSPSNVDSGLMPRAQPSVLGASSTATEQRVYVREQEIVGAALTSAGQNVGGYIGSSAIEPQSTMTASMEWWGASFHPGLSSGDSWKVYNYWRALINAPTKFTARVVYEGDSIEQNVLGFRDNYGTFQVAKRQFIGNPELFNIAIAGIKLNFPTGARNGILQKIASDKALIHPTLPTIFKLRAGTNDIGGGANASDIYAHAATYIQTLRAEAPARVKVVLATITPLLSSAAPVKYAALVRGNSAGADGIIDYSITGPGAMNAGAERDTTWYGNPVDIHPTEAAHAIMAPIDVIAINDLLQNAFEP